MTIGARTAIILALYAFLTVAMTWPQARQLATAVGDADDPLLSIWRISWIAHVLVTSPADLFNGNIFYPERRTLAYTDAAPLQGLVAAPFILAGVSQVLMYNLILLGSIALSGTAMWLLAYRYTRDAQAAVLAGIIFAFVPFRFDHYMHLELQATVFLVLALWWLDRAVESGAWADVAGFAASVVLQTYSGLYYVVFLGTALAIALPLRLADLPRDRIRPLVMRLTAAAAVSALLVLPYLTVYLHNRDVLGERGMDEVLLYSAVPFNYLATPVTNVLHGWWSSGLGSAERRLFPGVIAIVLAAIGLASRDRRKTFLVIVGAVGLVLSLGLHTPIYTILRDWVFVYRGLRAPARASILVFVAVALLAAYGWSRIGPRLRGSRVAATTLIGLLMLVEYANPAAGWLVLSPTPSASTRWLAQQPRSVIVEFPLPQQHTLYWVYDGLFMYASTFHWQPMLNGYSGFYPRSYLELLERMQGFPDQASIDYLKQREVDLIILHGRYLSPQDLAAWASALLARRDITVMGTFPQSSGNDLIFRLHR